MSARARQPTRGKSSGTPGPAAPGRAPSPAAAPAAPADFEKLGVFYLGRPYDLDAKRPGPGPLLYDSKDLADALRIAPSDARRIIEHAVARPATPIYSELSQILQIALHRALTRQQEPRAALQQAAADMRSLLARTELDVQQR